MASHEETLRSRIALGWVIELVILAFMLLHMTIDSILMENDFRSLKADPGPEGLAGLVYLVAIFALMPILVHVAHGAAWRGLRWVVVVVAVLGFLFFLLHHFAHWYYGTRPDFGSHVLDLTVHAVGLWVIASSIRWARFPAPPATST